MHQCIEWVYSSLVHIHGKWNDIVIAALFGYCCNMAKCCQICRRSFAICLCILKQSQKYIDLSHAPQWGSSTLLKSKGRVCNMQPWKICRPNSACWPACHPQTIVLDTVTVLRTPLHNKGRSVWFITHLQLFYIMHDNSGLLVSTQNLSWPSFEYTG